MAQFEPKQKGAILLRLFQNLALARGTFWPKLVAHFEPFYPTEVGWDSGRAIRLKKDHNNPNLFTFTGVLKEASSGSDRNMFKLLGQNDWGPVSFHSKTQQESLLESKYVHENLPGDHKWSIDPRKPGTYVIKVDLLKETIRARYTDSYLYAVYINGVEWQNLNEAYPLNCNNADSPIKIEIVPVAGKTVDKGNIIEFTASKQGLNILDFTIISEDGINKKSYKLKFSKPFEFYSLITQVSNSALTINVDPDKNGGYKFVAFEWYEDGVLVGENKPQYTAGKSSKNLLNKDATYLVKLTDANGNKYQTCPTKLDLSKSNHFLLYPSYVQVGEIVNVKLESNQIIEKSKLNVINLNGSIVYKKNIEGNVTSFAIHNPGVYLVQLISESRIRTAKLLVRQ